MVKRIKWDLTNLFKNMSIVSDMMHTYFNLGIFGGVIQDPGLTKKGIIHESISLLICIAIGKEIKGYI